MEDKNRMRKVRLQNVILCLLCVIAVLSMSITSTGCQKKEAPKTVDPSATGAPADSSNGDTGGDSGSDSGGSAEAGGIASEEISIPASDRNILYGKLYDPSQMLETDAESDSSASQSQETQIASQKYPLVILLHALDGSYRDWGKLPAKLVAKGYAVFAMDLRGHGKSAYKEGSDSGLSWREFEESDWKKYPRDITQVIDFFAHTEDYPQVNAKQVSIVGASIGANTALVAGLQNLSSVKTVVALSPGEDYKGIRPGSQLVTYNHPILFLVSQSDTYAYNSTQVLYRLTSGEKAIHLYKNIGHGTDMLHNDPKVEGSIVDWIVKYMPGNAFFDVKPTASKP